MQILVQKDGQQLGPYTLDQVNEYLAQGSLQATDPAWHEGLADWCPLNQIAGVVDASSPAPPAFDPAAFNPNAAAPPAVVQSDAEPDPYATNNPASIPDKSTGEETPAVLNNQTIHTDSGWDLRDVVLAVLVLIGIAGTLIAVIWISKTKNYSYWYWNIFAIITWIIFYFRIASAIADLFKKDRPSWEWTKTRVVMYSTALIGFVIMILIAWIISFFMNK